MISKKIFVYLILGTLIIGGCSEASAPEIENVTGQILKNEVDNTAYEAAIRTQNISFCEKITDQKDQQACISGVENEKKLMQALSNADSKLCSEISNEDKKKVCEIKIEVILQEKEAKQKNLEQIREISKLAGEIIQSGNHLRCKELNDSNFAMACELNILSNQAIQEKDVEVCDKASSKEIAQECKLQAGF